MKTQISYEKNYTKTPRVLWCDSLRVIYFIANLGFHSCMKYIEINFYFIHDMIVKIKLQVQFVAIDD
jgi:hypothetical protein